MFELSEDAKKELDAYFEGKEPGTIRIFLAPGGCSGPSLRLALDEPGEGDATQELDGYNFCIERGLLDQTGGGQIEVGPMGFIINPVNPLPEMAGGGCGGCCGGCGSN